MKLWIRNEWDASVSVAEVNSSRVRIGNQPSNDIVLDSPFIPPFAVVLVKTDHDGWQLVSAERAKCRLNNQPVPPGRKTSIGHGSRIELYPFHLEVDRDVDAAGSQDSREQLDARMSELIQRTHVHLLSLMDLDTNDKTRRNNASYLLSMEHHIEEIVQRNGITERNEQLLVAHIAGAAVRQSLCEKLVGAPALGEMGDNRETWSKLVTRVPDLETEMRAVVDGIGTQLRLSECNSIEQMIQRVSADFWSVWESVVDRLLGGLLLYIALREVKKQIKDIVFGYGPLQDLLRMPDITEIMVVSREKIYVERNGVIEDSGRKFVSDDVTLAIIERIVSKVGRRIDKSEPLVDARLGDGSRVNAIISPLSISGPSLTIRKFPARRLTTLELVETGSLTPTVAKFLQASVVARKNIIVSGGTGSGKTTLLNCLSEFIPNHERIVTVEDTGELQLTKEHVVRLETKKKNVEQFGEYTIRDLVKNTLRMNPDRIVVGECRGPEALDMLQAMNTGHDGSLTTIHANSPSDVPLRLEVLIGGELPVDSIRRQICSAVDLIVQTNKVSGQRFISHVSEVMDLDSQTGSVRLTDLFVRETPDSPLLPTGHLPSYMDHLIENELLDLESFYL